MFQQPINIQASSFLSSLAEIIKQSDGTVTVKLDCLPKSYRNNIANLCDKMKRRRGISLSFDKVGPSVIFRLK